MIEYFKNINWNEVLGISEIKSTIGIRIELKEI